jgi:nicotinamide riboside kinase
MEENLKQFQVSGNDIIKIAIYGPESTGKTTLCNQLADHFKTERAPEFARNYLQQKWDSKKEICTPDDLMPIAIGQMDLENDALKKANNYLFVDTCLMTTKVFSEIYYGFCDSKLDKAARKHKYDLFFLTDIDVPWEKDDLRDSPKEREITFEKFKQALIENHKPFIVLTGNPEIRFQKALAIIEGLTKAKQLGFSSQDFLQILDSEIPITEIEKQLNIYKKGIPKANLNRPAVIDDGILKLTDIEFLNYSSLFDSKKDNFKLKKFIPASGAASRMFKFLIEFLNEFDIENETINSYINRKEATELTIFLAGMEKFPFYLLIKNQLETTFSDYKYWSKDQQNYYFIELMLKENHFDFSNKPKGVLPFHIYKNQILTPIEEHLNEGVLYSCANGILNLHFTVSESHKSQFESCIESVKSTIEQATGHKISISFSHQHKFTDSITVDFKNKPFRDINGELVFRPGGHGALIENLNLLDVDIVFIKNIDNVIQNEVETVAFYKKALAGLLIELQEKVNFYLSKIDSIAENETSELVNFIEQQLSNKVNTDISKYTLENKISYLKEILNRPIRVCGMVKNEGEPGGGPFWVTDTNGNITLQIVESAQIDFSNESQSLIASKATHFNPVDLVCGLKDYKGSKFDFRNFIDHNSGFIVEKNKFGKPIKGYELPGLWNGAMAKWITVFVEVPLITFNPVKTVNDLLKPAHQNQ